MCATLCRGPRASPLYVSGLNGLKVPLQATPFISGGPKLGFSQPVSLLEFPFSALGFLGTLWWQTGELSQESPEWVSVSVSTLELS